MEHVIIGVDPHKLSATIEVVDRHEKRLGSGRFSQWAPEHLAHRLLEPPACRSGRVLPLGLFALRPT